MAKARVEIETDIAKTLKLLDRAPKQLKDVALANAVKNVGHIVANRAEDLAPKPGYPGDKPGLMPLNQTIDVNLKLYNNVVFAAVGPRYPQGAHGHLVEFGHEKYLWGRRASGRVPAYPFLERAGDETVQQQRRTFLRIVQKQMNQFFARHGFG